jgi:hypothetical protein
MAATITFGVILKSQGKCLRTPEAPAGILSYEFAWSPGSARTILKSWESIKDKAKKQLLVDYAFLLFYPLFLSLGCAMLADSRLNQMAAVGIVISWAVLVSGPLDGIENLALLRMLKSGETELLVKTAGLCAGIKFVLVFSGLGYIVLQGLAVIDRCLRGT